MASTVDICNLSLAFLGEEADIQSLTPPDSVNAGYCKQFYPIARDAMLEQHNWSFASARITLALLDIDLPAEWAFAYARPSCLKVVAVYPPAQVLSATPVGAIFDQSEFINRARAFPFLCESLDNGDEVIYSNVEDATALYTRRITDTTKFRPLVVTALARLLASYLAGPVIKGTVGMKVSEAHLKQYEQVDGPRARASDAQNGRDTSYDTFIPSSLLARR